MTVRISASGERYDDRFVCRWHPHPDGVIEHGLYWCGLDCPVQRYRVACRIEAELSAEGRLPSRSHVFDDRWDRLRRWALGKEAA